MRSPLTTTPLRHAANVDGAESIPCAPALFLFTGEGAHAGRVDAACQAGPLYHLLESALQQTLKGFLARHLGEHAAPDSPLVTTVVNILYANRWRAAGHAPRLALGHSIGEVAAAYMVGLLSVCEALATARTLGLAGCQCAGAMVHTRLARDEVDAWSDPLLCIAAVNGVASSGADDARLSVTLCGPKERMEAWVSTCPGAKMLAPPHPWHHPMFLDVPGVRDGSAFASLPEGLPSAGSTAAIFLSAKRVRAPEERLDAAYWREWLTTTVYFHEALERAAAMLSDTGCYTIETGAHDSLTHVAVATLSFCGVRVVGSAASMRHGQPDGFWKAQRSQLEAQIDARREGWVGSRAAPLHAITTRLHWLLATSFHMDTNGVSADAPLMESGLESDDVPSLVEQLNAAFSVWLPPTFLFERSSIREIAEHLADADASITRVSACVRSARRVVILPYSLVVRFPGAPTLVRLYALQAAGGDAAHQVPSSRWLPAPISTLAERHGAFLAAAQHFDGGFFGISPAEAHAMDPQQRQLLEVGYASLHGTGERLPSLRTADVGAFLGIMNADFAAMQTHDSVYAATGATISIAAGRLSFALGTQGPCVSVDTACSSALVALHGASSDVAAGECGQAFTIGASLMLIPHTHRVFGRAGMLSADGRCKTFDSRANGYARGEGVGAVTLCESANGVALLSCCVRSDGKSSSLTAPNGIAQARLICSALAAADAKALRTIEAHGTGTPLGDPTEAGGMERALGATAACLGGVKPSLGHNEPVAGLTGLVMLMQTGRQVARSANAELRLVNPLLTRPLRGLIARLPTQSLIGVEAKAGGLSSFGYSGTIGHAVLGQASHATTHGPPPLVYNRRAVTWGALTHPFVQIQVPCSEDAAIFRSKAASFDTLVSHHVVQDCVVFPGAGYLEMVRLAAGSALCDVFFLQPLAIEALELLVECALEEGRFEVRSVADAQADAAVHCSGALTAHRRALLVEHALVCGRSCPRVTHVDELYDSFNLIGLQYGPGYRTLAHTWGGASEAAARLRTAHEGIALHPAYLDDGLCLGIQTLIRGSSETWLPFAVESACLQFVPGSLWAVHGRDF